MKSRTSCWRAVSSAIDVQPNTVPSQTPPARKELRLIPKTGEVSHGGHGGNGINRYYPSIASHQTHIKVLLDRAPVSLTCMSPTCMSPTCMSPYPPNLRVLRVLRVLRATPLSSIDTNGPILRRTLYVATGIYRPEIAGYAGKRQVPKRDP